jgi:tRNA-2-methylthio-N6-dimethylallyladenosine synthase
MKKAFVKSYGCQMNVYDGERMQEQLAAIGYGLTAEAEDADLIVLNTCHIREKAAEKIYSELGKLRRTKTLREKTGKETLIAVAGCVAQAEGAEMIAREKSVDLVIGPQSYHRLPDLIAERRASGKAVIETEFPEDGKFAGLEAPESRTPLTRNVTAFLTVQEGCDKFCTFCVVPYTRGAEYSRPLADVEAEARRLAELGVRELTLLGQNVNAYHGADETGKTISLAALVARLSRIDGIVRLRYMTSHLRDMTDDLIAAHAENPKLMPYLHLPVQSGSNRVLKAMNRGHTAETYLRMIEKVRAARPDLALSGDFIVGFPGETEKDFESTLNLVRDARYAAAYSFKYSPRPGTPAAERSDQVEEAVKDERLQRLQALLRDQQQAFNQACVGKTLEILLEKPGREPGQLIGRSPYLQAVHLPGQNLNPGDLIQARIEAVGTNSLSAHYRVAA